MVEVCATVYSRTVHESALYGRLKVVRKFEGKPRRAWQTLTATHFKRESFLEKLFVANRNSLCDAATSIFRLCRELPNVCVSPIGRELI